MAKKVGYAFVVGDLLHIGHLKFFRKCKQYCDFLIVGVYTDELAASYKRKPIIPFEERFELVKLLRLVDMAVKVEYKDCTPTLKSLREKGFEISFVFHGDDWTIDDIEGRAYIEAMGAKIILTPYHEGRNTSSIISEIRGL